MLLNKDQIMKADDLPFRDIDVPEWGGSVRVRTMTGGERDAFEAQIYDADSNGVRLNRDNFRAKLLTKVLVDDTGTRLFSDKEILLLSNKSAKAIQKLFDAAQELNGLSVGEQEAVEKK